MQYKMAIIITLCYNHPYNVTRPLKSTMWVQITPSYSFADTFSSECDLLFPQISEESPLHSVVVIDISFS